MTSDVFWLQVLLSFVVGGLYIGIMTRLAERFGSKLGGLLIAMPSIVLIGLIFIAWTQDAKALTEASSIMPATIAASSIFLVIFSLFYRKFGLSRAYFGAIAVWFALNLPLVWYGLASLGWALVIGGVLLSISTTFFHHQPDRNLPPFQLSQQVFVFRIVFAGSFVALAVLLSHLLGPLWGGLFASFPAAFSSSVLILAAAHGNDFITSASKTMVNGNLVNVVFVSALYLLVTPVGAALAIIVSYLICLLFAVFSYRYIVPRI